MKKNKKLDNQNQVEENVETIEVVEDQQTEMADALTENIEEDYEDEESGLEKFLEKAKQFVKKQRIKAVKKQAAVAKMGKVGKFFMKINEEPILACVVMAIATTIIIEALSRRTIGGALLFIVHSPLIFLLDILIILFTLLLSLLVRKRLFAISLISIVWLALGTVNYCMLSYRTTPFSWIDIKLLKSVGSIMSQYLNIIEFVLIIIVAILLVIGVITLWVRIPKMKKKVKYFKAVALIATTFVVAYSLDKIEVKAGIIDLDLGNIAYTYDQCGFSYCFLNSIVNVGIDKPYNYSEDLMTELKTDLQDLDKRAALDRPNIIFVQLESFYDVTRMADYTYSENPVPNWQKLREEYSSGYMTVPSIGAGTANTEFEVITGMSLDYFGFCEYPYKTILKDNNCESICYNLQELGYTNHVIHNNRGNFYSRNKVFPRLGFNNFVSLEYMQDPEYNANDWVKDDILIDEIIDTMKSTDNQDFIYTITVQCHGKYPEEVIDDTQTITMEGEEDVAIKNQFEYYINQIKEEDQFIKDLTDALNAFDEEVVVVMYGDHLPTFEMTNDDLSSGTLYQTEYVLWSNFDMDVVKEDYNTFQIGSVVLGRLGFDNGALTKLHQNYMYSDDYEEKLDLLQYDMLYGKKYVYDGHTPYTKTALHMGKPNSDAYIDAVTILEQDVYVHGDNFNEWSCVYVNGTKKETEFDNSQNLIVKDCELKEGDRVIVKQLAGGTSSLSKTEEYIY